MTMLLGKTEVLKTEKLKTLKPKRSTQSRVTSDEWREAGLIVKVERCLPISIACFP